MNYIPLYHAIIFMISYFPIKISLEYLFSIRIRITTDFRKVLTSIPIVQPRRICVDAILMGINPFFAFRKKTGYPRFSIMIKLSSKIKFS